MHTNIIRALTPIKKNSSGNNSHHVFFAQGELARDALSINVKGFGELPVTLDADAIGCLKALATDAKYGLRENTLLDKKVRDTLEITADRVSVNDPDDALAALLKRMQIQLGLPKQTKLSAHLHNLLIYGPGQFFDKHRDSEKLPGMVATLIVVLPCAHIGGDLHIEQGQDKFVFSSENLDSNACQCITFYADCKHHITPVRQGHRIALTFNVVMNSALTDIESQGRNQALETALIEYFDNKKNLADHAPASRVHKLAYILEHSYSEHSLQWHLLKGIDQQNAIALRDAAQYAGLVPHLALLEWHESWIAPEEDEREELIEADITLSHWIDQNNQAQPYQACAIEEDEVCSEVDIQDEEPDKSEYEGYMGNYGGTQDYWYRRAAIVLWRKNDSIAANFQINFEAAQAKLLELTEKPGNEQEVAQTIPTLVPHLHKLTNSYLEAAFKLAVYAKNPQTAHLLLAQGSVTQIQTNAH